MCKSPEFSFSLSLVLSVSIVRLKARPPSPTTSFSDSSLPTYIHIPSAQTGKNMVAGRTIKMLIGTIFFGEVETMLIGG